jgi:hypothetical protein
MLLRQLSGNRYDCPHLNVAWFDRRHRPQRLGLRLHHLGTKRDYPNRLAVVEADHASHFHAQPRSNGFSVRACVPRGLAQRFAAAGTLVVDGTARR